MRRLDGAVGVEPGDLVGAVVKLPKHLVGVLAQQRRGPAKAVRPVAQLPRDARHDPPAGDGVVGSVEHAVRHRVEGAIRQVANRLHRKSGKLALCRLTEPVREILKTSRLLDYFCVVETLPEAVEALR